MKKIIAALFIGQAIAAAAFFGIQAHDNATTEAPETFTFEMQDANLQIHHGTISEAVHASDFSGHIWITDDNNGLEYYGNFDSEDFSVGDSVVFATVPVIPGDRQAWTPEEVEVIRAHVY